MTVKVKPAKPTDEEQVNEWMKKLAPDMKSSVDAARKIIKTAGPKLNERIKSDLLQGDYKDRRLVYLNSEKEIKDAEKELERIVKESVKMIDK